MLCDVDPLVAIIDRSDKKHIRCLAALGMIRSQLITTGNGKPRKL